MIGCERFHILRIVTQSEYYIQILERLSIWFPRLECTVPRCDLSSRALARLLVFTYGSRHDNHLIAAQALHRCSAHQLIYNVVLKI